MKLRRTYERFVVWLIGKLADTIVRPAPLELVSKLELKPFMHVVFGDNGVRHIGIYCDGLWKSLNGYPEMGIQGEIGFKIVGEHPKKPKRVKLKDASGHSNSTKSRRVRRRNG
jgi:hypothetical protein